MQYIIKWSVQHKSMSHLENSCKILWAKWFTNYTLVAKWKLSCQGVKYRTTLSGSNLDELTNHKTSWNDVLQNKENWAKIDGFAQILKSVFRWGRLYRFTDHISNCPSQKKIELKSINLRKKHKSVSHPKNGSKSLRAKWLTNYILDILCR